MSQRLLHEYVTTAAAERPQATALVMGEQRMTFAELEAASNRLAHALLAAGCRPADRVCLLAAKAPETVAAMLAVLKAGGIYVPVDVAQPLQRTARIVEQVEPAAVFVDAARAALPADLRRAGALAPATAILTARDADGAPPDPHPVRGRPRDTAHIIFTSGSTGRPKGVIVTHASATAFVGWAVDHFGIRPGERLSGHPPLHFDLSTFDVFGALRAGAELHLVPPETILPRQLADLIAGSELHQLFCVPSALAWLSHLGAVPDGGFPSLRRILWCGEVLPTPVLIDWMARHPQATFTNLYGPTEAAIASSHHMVRTLPAGAREPIPIGTACPGEELLVLDDALAPVPDGETGELCIAGVGLSPGYWRDPQATAQAFVRDPRPDHSGGRIYRTGDLGRRGRDGILHFLGRRDSQIKCRGYRIELGEIEAAIGALPEVAECAVVGVPVDGFEGVAICCAAATGSAPAPAPTALNTRLREALPVYMLPARWSLMGELPKNQNGKIDRRALQEMFARALTVGAGDR